MKRLNAIVRKETRKNIQWLKQRPRLVIYLIITVCLCLGNYFISTILSNELIVRKVDNPYLQLSDHKTPIRIQQSMGCTGIADQIQTLINAKPSTQFAQQSDIYCGFLTDDYILEVDFPQHSPEQIPKSHLINISNGVVYTLLPNYGFVQPENPTFVPDVKKCSVLMMISQPVIVSVMYPSHAAYPCGTAQGIAQFLVKQFMVRHI